MFIRVHLWLICCLLAGCATFPGEVHVARSAIDGERQVRIDPGWVPAGGFRPSLFKLGGFWTERAPDVFHLEIVCPDLSIIDKLEIGIDGQITAFEPSGDPRFWDWGSVRRFTVPLEFVERMAAGKRVVIRLSLGQECIEGIFSEGGISCARPGFKRAVPQIQQLATAPR